MKKKINPVNVVLSSASASASVYLFWLAFTTDDWWGYGWGYGVAAIAFAYGAIRFYRARYNSAQQNREAVKRSIGIVMAG